MTFARVAATLALVFAMTGGAYAARKYIITSTKQISPKVLKALEGKTGPAGPAGLAGPAGPAGTAGLRGEKGEKGDRGLPGEPGQQGIQGIEGKEGSPWTLGGTLPSGKSETGVWGIAALPGSFAGGLVEFAYTSVSFPIPLKGALPETKVHVIAAGGKGAGGKTCPTTSSVEKPEAEPGNLCIFQRQGGINVGSVGTFSPGTEETGEVGRTGVLVQVQPATKGQSVGVTGTWAVTAE